MRRREYILLGCAGCRKTREEIETEPVLTWIGSRIMILCLRGLWMLDKDESEMNECEPDTEHAIHVVTFSLKVKRVANYYGNAACANLNLKEKNLIEHL